MLVNIDLFGNNDLSSLNIEVLGAGGDPRLRICTNESNNIVKLGKIVCERFELANNSSKGISPVGVSFKTGSSIEVLDLSRCSNLETISGSNLDVQQINLNTKIIRHNLIKTGLADKGTVIRLQ